MKFEKRLWVDDERPLPKDLQDDAEANPEHRWRLVTSSDGAIRYLTQWKARPHVTFEEISLDHDLGGDDTAMTIVNWMAEHGYWPKVVTVHTANPVGRNNLLRALNAEAPAEVDIFIRYW
jgi:hypothetical protein